MDEALHAAIAAVIPNCFGTVAPANAQTPYVIWQRIGGDTSEYLDNEDSQLDGADVQIRIFSQDVLEPKRLMPLLVSALRQHPDLTIRPVGNFRDDFDHDMNLFVADRDFEVNYHNTYN
ncbi:MULTISPECIES: DUF3168 domain-containing protein [Comamonas]|uniref:tail completion protein gp17 n=1 Tax=Comamonas TaxID=283 RepID=UPI0001DA6A7F|nr:MULTISPECIES: DUF3168 domain-containing protein [Comamonas]EFI63718.1 hypothetical protein CTS44_00409 [Comamonas thiooxydans]TFF59291.1 DUF3168 domain-containing protein [Comamonas sp. A23]